MTLRGRLADLLFPPKCPFCGRVGDQVGPCAACRKILPWTQGDDREQMLPGVLRCASPLFYEGAARDGILRLKFQGAAGAAESLGELLADAAAERFSGAFDVVTWVPVSRRRLRRRGYDQARLLAEAACRRWGVRPERLVRKLGDNPPQSGIAGGPSARRANVLGLYAAEPACAGRRVLLIDDVVTTGATLQECARALRDAGAADVLALTLARTPRQKTAPSRDRT
jgi:ComF family protein